MCVSSYAILIDVIRNSIHRAQISETNKTVHLNIKPCECTEDQANTDVTTRDYRMSVNISIMQ